MEKKQNSLLFINKYGLVMRKPAFCIFENKDADQLRGNREADQRHCFRYIASKIPLLPKYKISSLQPSSVCLQPGSCPTWSETPKTGFLTKRLKYGIIPIAPLSTPMKMQVPGVEVDIC